MTFWLTSKAVEVQACRPVPKFRVDDVHGRVENCVPQEMPQKPSVPYQLYVSPTISAKVVKEPFVRFRSAFQGWVILFPTDKKNITTPSI